MLRDLVLKRGPIPLADAYFRGRLDVEGDLYEALGLKHHFQNLTLSGRERFALLLDALRLKFAPGAAGSPAGEPPATTRVTHDHTMDIDRPPSTHQNDDSNDI